MLPGKTGYDICRELMEEGNNTPIIMITCQDGRSQIKFWDWSSGADDYISKPFGIRELYGKD